MKTLLASFVNTNSIASSLDDVVERILAHRSQKKSVHIVTLNAEMALAATHDEELARIISTADIVVADSISIQFWLRLRNISVNRIAGIDCAEVLAKRKEHHPVALIGGRTADSASRAAHIFFSEVTVAIAQRGPQIHLTQQVVSDQTMKDVRDSRACLVLVGFGHGKQERWIAAARNRDTEPRVWIGVGGAIDVWSGDIRRAPRVMRMSGLEWLWRMFVEPERLIRIIRATVVFPVRALTEMLLY